jgi:DNA-binding response OmpR family regulator
VPRTGHIVIFEPDDLMRELLRRWLDEAGYGVTVPPREDDPCVVPPILVIADISRPEGADAAIRTLRAAYAAPILALSTRFRRGRGGSTDAAQRLGVCNVLPKPFSRDELLAAVDEAITRPDPG